jgi:G3E family GTPase
VQYLGYAEADLRSGLIMAASTVPVTLLTGYLGSGKTTLLNRILTEQHGQKIAVIVNEFGEVGIDHQLIIDADEEIFEMNNGCICCTVRGDLIRIIGNLMQRRDKFDRLVIETTGLADPAPVIQTFFVDDDVQEQTHLDAVVTMVDTKHVLQHWETAEVQEQIAFADVIALNKIDLVSAAELDALEQKIRSMNAIAKIYRTQNSALAIDQVLGLDAFSLERALEIDPDFLGEEAHEHDETVSSIAITKEGALDGEKLNDWMSDLVRTQGENIFRMKGILHLAGRDHRFVFQGVHMLFDGRQDRLWSDTEKRLNQLVFIGRGLDQVALEKGFEHCLV